MKRSLVSCEHCSLSLSAFNAEKAEFQLFPNNMKVYINAAARRRYCFLPSKKNCEISVKFGGAVQHGPEEKPLRSGEDPSHGAAPGSPFLLPENVAHLLIQQVAVKFNSDETKPV